MREKLTKTDIRKIEEEITHRKLVIRKEALEGVKEARAHGDLSENFEYKAAKKYKNENESRIRYLERVLKTAVLVENDSGADEIGLNNTVEVYFEEDDEYETYKIVTSIRGNSLRGMISTESPIGKALMHRKLNERVFVKTGPTEGYYIKITKIEHTSDEESDKIRGY